MSNTPELESCLVPGFVPSEKGGEIGLPTCVHCHVANSSVRLLEVFCTLGVDSICRQVQRQLQRNELARFYHHRTRKCIPPRKLRREIQ